MKIIMGTFIHTILCLTLLIKVILGANFVPKDNILLDCGSFDPISTDSDGRKWTSDNGSPFLASRSGTFRAIGHTQPRGLKVPYVSARIMTSNTTYLFRVSSPGGRFFIRLHFYSTTYSRSNAANANFSVVASGAYTLLRNFNAAQALSRQPNNDEVVVKEYYVNVEGDVLKVDFVPGLNSFAFVNGIEIVSVPSLYDNEVGVNLLGAAAPFQIEKSTALESLFRLNVGGKYIPPTNDTGLFRSWFDDTPYILSGRNQGATADIDPDLNITFPKSVPSYSAPIDVYSTTRLMTPDNNLNLKFNLTWLFPIDNRFAYLVRLHFCDIFSRINKVNQIVFNVYLRNQTAYSGVDLVALTDSNGIPYIMEFVVILPNNGDFQEDLWLALHPDTSDKPEYYNAFLNGLELFRINNTDGSFAL